MKIQECHGNINIYIFYIYRYCNDLFLGGTEMICTVGLLLLYINALKSKVIAFNRENELNNFKA